MLYPTTDTATAYLASCKRGEEAAERAPHQELPLDLRVLVIRGLWCLACKTLTADPPAGSSSPSSSKPSAPKSGPAVVGGGSSPSKPKSPVSAPPKAPKAPKIPELPKLPKPDSGRKPPKGSLPGYTPGHPPYHGSGGHLPVAPAGSQPHEHDHDHDHNRASPVRSCINPKGFDRLRCEKADAIFGTLFAIIALMLVPLMLYLFIRRCKRNLARRKGNSRGEEEGMELTQVAPMHYHPVPRNIDRGSPDGASNIGLALSTSEETCTLAKEERAQNAKINSDDAGRKPPPPPSSSSSSVVVVLEDGPQTGSESRGRTLDRRPKSRRSGVSSLSSGMIRTAVLGQALQDPTVVDVSSSWSEEGSRKISERTGSCDGPSDCERGRGDDGGAQRERCEDNDVARARVDCGLRAPDGRKEVSEDRRERSCSSRRSSVQGSAQQQQSGVGFEENKAGDDAASVDGEEEEWYMSSSLPSSEEFSNVDAQDRL